MSQQLQVGDPAPNFELLNQQNDSRSLLDYSGKWLVLYFYPKDNTPGCTAEAIAFTQLIQKFSSQNASIVGVSPDSTTSHQRFIEKKSLEVELLSDSDKIAVNQFGVWQKKKMAGREYFGVVRTTFLIDPKGIIRHKWEKVKVKGHAEDVLEQCCTISR